MTAQEKLMNVLCRDSLTESGAIEAMREYGRELLMAYADVSESYAKYLINDFEGQIIYNIDKSKIEMEFNQSGT